MSDFVYRPRKVPSVKSRKKVNQMMGRLTVEEREARFYVNECEREKHRQGAGRKNCWIEKFGNRWKGICYFGGVKYSTQPIQDPDAAKIAARRMYSLLEQDAYMKNGEARRGTRGPNSSPSITL